jgi:hypothetical protein
MKTLIKIPIPSLLIALACIIGLGAKTQAVSPAPDGCYPGFTTAEGCNALLHLTSGAGNTGVGWYSLFSAGAHNYNTGVGAGTLVINGADDNTATGAAALLLNTSGHDNTANGTDALVHNDSGNFDNAVGAFALFHNTSGSFNNALGADALFSNVVATDNTAVGDLALRFNDSDGAGHANANTAVGSLALTSNTDGDDNAAVGFDALGANTTGIQNEAMGSFAAGSNTEGSFNVAIGGSALIANVHGSYNTVLGWKAGLNVEGTDDIYIGDSAGLGVSAEDLTIRIGNPSFASNCYIAGIFGNATPGIPVYIDAMGHLGTTPSSKRFKDEIKPMDNTSEAILALKPVTFRYKKEYDAKGTPQFGLVAEEVAKVNPDLVYRDAEGKVYTVRYDAVNAMLLNEFLKEHKKVEEQQASIAELKSTVAQQQKGMEVLTAQLKEQASQIQKVSAQLEVSKLAPQTVLNNQ